MRALLAVALLLCTDAAFAQDHSQHRQHAAIPQSPPTTAHGNAPMRPTTQIS